MKRNTYCAAALMLCMATLCACGELSEDNEQGMTIVNNTVSFQNTETDFVVENQTADYSTQSVTAATPEHDESIFSDDKDKTHSTTDLTQKEFQNTAKYSKTTTTSNSAMDNPHAETDVLGNKDTTKSTSSASTAHQSNTNVKESEKSIWVLPTEQQVKTTAILGRDTYVADIDAVKNIFHAEDIVNYIRYFHGPNDITFLYQLNEEFPIEYFVKPVEAAPYCVYKVDNGDTLFVFFNENEDSLRDVTYFFLVKDKLTQASFSGISSGSTLADVEAIDRGTQLIDSVNASSLSKGITLHMVENGFIKITYEGGIVNRRTSKIDNPNDFIVKKITFIPNGDAIDIPRIFEDGSVHFTITKYDS